MDYKRITKKDHLYMGDTVLYKEELFVVMAQYNNCLKLVFFNDYENTMESTQKGDFVWVPMEECYRWDSSISSTIQN